MFNFIVKTALFSSFLVTSIVAKAHTVNDYDKIIAENNVANPRTAKKSHLRVINGIEDSLNRYPFVVALGVPVELLDVNEIIKRILKRILYPEFYPSCTGSLVNEKWVLTASHCIKVVKGRTVPTRIRYGHMTVAPNDTRATFSDVQRAIQHPSYYKYPKNTRNDIALLLVNKVHLNVYGRLSAVDYRTLIGLPVIYTGYGSTNGSKSEETRLSRQHRSRLYGEAAVVPCSKLLLSQPMICLARKCANKRQQAYYGDSGGALLHAGRIVGVCSSVDGEEIFKVGMAKATVMYTAASPFLDWIFTTMSQSP